MTKRLPTPPQQETVTLSKSSVDLIFKTLDEMKEEIASLRKRLEGVPAMDDEILNSIEAAKFCGVVRQTIYAWTREGRIKKAERKGKRGYLKSELDRVNRFKGR